MSRAGIKAFEKCDVKKVEFKDFVYVSRHYGEIVLSKKPSEDTRTSSGHSAVLHCPRTVDDIVNIESEFTNHSSRIDALNSLKKLAGELICRDCMFSTMSPVEVSLARADLAEAELKRIDSYNALQMARKEVEAFEL